MFISMLAVIDKMKKVILLIFIFLFGTSFHKRELVVDETGFDDIRIGQTTISKIKRKHLFAKRTRTWRHVLFRTSDGGRIGSVFYYKKIVTKDGITFLFNYERGTKEKIRLSGLIFDLPATIRTEKGIVLGQSSFKEVEEKYGKEATQLDKNIAKKDYGKVLFYSNKLIGQDSIDSNYIVTSV